MRRVIGWRPVYVSGVSQPYGSMSNPMGSVQGVTKRFWAHRKQYTRHGVAKNGLSGEKDRG